MTMRSPDKPICWFGHDRLVLNDVTPFGLHRYVIARKEEAPNVEDYLRTTQKMAGSATLEHWLIERDGFYYLWIVWKEQNGKANQFHHNA